jgi:hypothetical protein
MISQVWNNAKHPNTLHAMDAPSKVPCGGFVPPHVARAIEAHLCYKVEVSPKVAKTVLFVALVLSAVLLVELYSPVLGITAVIGDASLRPGVKDATKAAAAEKKAASSGKGAAEAAFGPFVPQDFSLHEQCFSDPRKPVKAQLAEDSFCYQSQAAKVAKDLEVNPGHRAALCWPPPRKAGAKRALSAIYAVPPQQCSWSLPIFHTIDGSEGNLANLVASFLATQVREGREDRVLLPRRILPRDAGAGGEGG